MKTTYTVTYWRGTTRLTGTATTPNGVRRLCAKNRNAYGPRIYDEAGNELHLTVETVVRHADGKRAEVSVLLDENGNPA